MDHTISDIMEALNRAADPLYRPDIVYQFVDDDPDLKSMFVDVQIRFPKPHENIGAWSSDMIREAELTWAETFGESRAEPRRCKVFDTDLDMRPPTDMNSLYFSYGARGLDIGSPSVPR